jgi:[acyl-carrier-protein] S-malonyltransferase
MKYQKIAFLFPGQGAQYPGMGKDFANAYPIAKRTFEEADDLLHRRLSTIMWHGHESTLTETRNSQTAIYVMSIALLRVLNHLLPDVIPSVTAGLSLGEYSALTAAAKLNFAPGLQLVEKRGQFMNEACEKTQGSMAVVMGLDGSVVEEMVQELRLPHDLWAANFNCPGQVVISGTKRGIEAGTTRAKEKGAKRVLPLPVHGAFHSGLMQPAEERLKEEILKTTLLETPIAIVMNYSGSYIANLDEIRRQLIKQVTNPVRWEQGIRAMMADGVDLFIEIGCGKTLAGMNKRIGVTVPTLSVEKIEDVDLLAKEISS